MTTIILAAEHDQHDDPFKTANSTYIYYIRYSFFSFKP